MAGEDEIGVDALDIASGEWTNVGTTGIEPNQIQFHGKSISWSK